MNPNNSKENWLGAKSLGKNTSDDDKDVPFLIKPSEGVANDPLHKGVHDATNHAGESDLFNDDLNYFDSQWGLKSIEKEKDNVSKAILDSNEDMNAPNGMMMENNFVS